MKSAPFGTAVHARAAVAYQRLSSQRQRTLVAPEDDMWATFADMAEPHSLTLGTQLVGRFSVDEDNQLHGFYIVGAYEEAATELLVRVVNEMRPKT